MKTTKTKLAVALMLLLALLAFFAALDGLLSKSLYDSLIPLGMLNVSMMPGLISQDIITIFAGAALAVLSVVYLRRPNSKVFIAALGLAAYFLYGYGLYAFGGVYTPIFVIYLVVFALSIYSLILGLSGLAAVNLYSLSKPLRIAISVFLLMIVAVFVPMWLVALQPFSPVHARPDMYVVLVLDLCIVMPALAVIAVLLLKGRPFGISLAGIALMKVFTLILSVVIGGFLQVADTGTTDYAMFAVYGVIVAISLVLGVLYFLRLKAEPKAIAEVM